jgi:DNA-binding XRE family transcriptional regulator
MEISPAQCRAARALLNWTQEMLATRAGAALKTVRDFETERRKPLNVARTTVRRALEEAGVEFFEDGGLRLRKQGSCDPSTRDDIHVSNGRLMFIKAAQSAKAEGQVGEVKRHFFTIVI